MKKLNENHKKNISLSRKNRIWINNGVKNTFIKNEDFLKYKNAGWIRGKLKIDKFWITNGLENKLVSVKEYDEIYKNMGYLKGRKI